MTDANLSDDVLGDLRRDYEVTARHVELARLEAAARAARVAADFANARHLWENLRRDVTGNAIALAVLDLHQPLAGFNEILCASCVDGEFEDEKTHASWECTTYGAIVKAHCPVAF